MRARTVVLLGAVVSLSSCLQVERQVLPTPTPFLNQQNGLTVEERNAYYKLDEGIHYMPWAMLDALRRPQPTSIFLRCERFLDTPERLGISRNREDPRDARALIGLTTSSPGEGYLPMAGINCATCHTSVLIANDQRLVVDGAASNFSIERFVTEMANSMLGTLIGDFGPFYDRYRANLAELDAASPPVGGRALVSTELSRSDRDELTAIDAEMKGPFAEQLRKLTDPDPATRKQLLEVLEYSAEGDERRALRVADVPGRNAYLDVLRKYESRTATRGLRSARTVSPACPASLGDACVERRLVDSPFEVFVYLIKRVALIVTASGYVDEDDTPAGLGRSHPWSVTKNMLRDRKKWVREKNVTAPIATPRIWDFEHFDRVFMAGVTNSMLERNLAQGVALVTDFDWDTNETPVSTRKLEAVSEFARKIRPPEWPAAFGPINGPVWCAGRADFAQHCAGCHPPAPRSDEYGVAINYRDVHTDPNYSQNQLTAFAQGKDFFVELGNWLETVKNNAYQREGVSEDERARFELRRSPSDWRPPNGNALEARPLRGVWASGPFFHNGSVRTLWQVLKPEARQAQFHVGSPKFDLKELGFADEAPDFGAEYPNAVFRTKDDGGVPIAGNSNAGHELPNLTDAIRQNLLEYLKDVDGTRPCP